MVGPPGTGKTAIVEGLAHRIRLNQVSEKMRNKRILKVTTASIVSGCELVGQFEKKMEKIMNYLIENPDVILFIDEIHTSIGAGTGNKSNLDLSEIMKPYIDRGQVKVIGATTNEEYNEFFANKGAFKRRFIKTVVNEPDDLTLADIINENILKFIEKTSVNWNFDSDTSEYIVSKLISCTRDKNRTWDDKRYNADLVLTILEITFANALREDSKVITVDHVASAIRGCSALYPSVREQISKEFEDYFEKRPIPNHSYRKVIKFVPLVSNS